MLSGSAPEAIDPIDFLFSEQVRQCQQGGHEHAAPLGAIFGPVMPIVTFDDLDEAIALANQTPYGLAAYVWTDDLRASVKIWEALEFGMVGINEWAPHATEAPFGGWKQSSSIKRAMQSRRRSLRATETR